MDVRFKGVFVPLVTPFKGEGLDKEGLKKLINYLIEDGATGLVPCGTTGEAPTLSIKEHKEVIEITIEEANGRVPVIAGTGSNETSKAVELTQHAEKAGADGALVVGPYYNKPTQAGIIEHFKAVARNTNLPIIIYNIPGRTGKNIEVKTVIELSKEENIVGIKEASGDINQVMDIIKNIENFCVLSGEDHIIFPICCLGGHGAIAASAHILPSEFLKICTYIAEGRIAEARKIHYKLLPLIRALFSEANPAPVKAAVAMLGLISSDEVRLPLVRATENCKKLLREELRKLGCL